MYANLLVLPFATKNHRYLYDAVTNRVFYAPDPTYAILQRYAQNRSLEAIQAELGHQYDLATLQKTYTQVKGWVDEGAFFVRRPIAVNDLTEEAYWQSLLQETGVRQLMLIVTDRCNLRCKYCVYSGDYQDDGYRQHGLDQMSFETAKAAIDYFYRLHEQIFLPNKLMVINFYGGEPLLRFDLLQQCAAYAHSLDERFIFAVTTNGTLMTEEHADFMIRYNVNLVFSLDGPEDEHNRNRVFATGEGTFDHTIRAINLLRTKDLSYFNEHVMVNTVYDRQSDLFTLNDFFVQGKDWLPRSGFVVPKRSAGDLSDDQVPVADQRSELLRRYMLAKMGHESYDTAFLDRFWQNFRYIVDRNYDRLENTDHYTARCIPGAKIAVRPDGSFHICERINERFPIGHVSTGIDFQRVQQVMRLYDQQVTTNCAQCIAARFCQVCYAQTCNETGFDIHSLCDNVAKDLEGTLACLYTILEENPDVFDEFNRRPRVVETVMNC